MTDWLQFVLDCLQLDFVDELDFQSPRACDDKRYCTYDLDVLSRILSTDKLIDLYRSLFLSWLFDTTDFDNTCWCPTVLSQYVKPRCIYVGEFYCRYHIKGMSPTPVNMVECVKDIIYSNVAERAYNILCEHSDEILERCILNNELTMLERSHIVTRFTRKLDELEQLFK